MLVENRFQLLTPPCGVWLLQGCEMPKKDGVERPSNRPLVRAALFLGALAVIGVMIWQALASSGAPDPFLARAGSPAAVLDIGVLVFREGLECILVLAAITATMVGSSEKFRRPIAVGVGLAFLATLLTWQIAVGILDSLAENISALHLQAATGLLAIIVLLVVMNWFFHKLYWTGWISLHTRKKRELMQEAGAPGSSTARVLWGLAALGFTSFYREGFEVVLFLQSYRLKLGSTPVLHGVLVGGFLTAVVALLTFIAHHRLPYRQMLVLTGVLLGGVLLVMVGEQAQEMQLAHWMTTTEIPSLARLIPPWMEIWFGLSPTVETLAAQVIAALLVIGSYTTVRVQLRRDVRETKCAAVPRRTRADTRRTYPNALTSN